MPLYNVELTLRVTIVVQAAHMREARDVAYNNCESAIDDFDITPVINITGDITQERHLKDGWDGHCIPYGGDGNTRISEILASNAVQSEDGHG